MSLIVHIAFSHLWGRKRQTVISILGAALGVGFYVGLSTLMLGFQQDFINRVINIQPHIVIQDNYRTAPWQPAERLFTDEEGRSIVSIDGLKPRDEVHGVRTYRQILDALGGIPGVRYAPSFSGQVLLRFGSKDISATLNGIVPDRERHISTLEDDLIEGELNDLYTTANGLIIGEGMASRGGLKRGDTVSAIATNGSSVKMKIVGIFFSGTTSKDNNEAYTLLKKVQSLHDRPNVINRISIKMNDIYNAENLASWLEGQFGYRAVSWQETSRNIMTIFMIQRLVIFSSVGAILTVACFGIFNVVSTVVYEKIRDIAILRSMGFSSGDIRLIFVLEGLLVGLAGAVVGWGLGYAIVEGLATIRLQPGAASGPGGGLSRSQGLVLDRTLLHYVIGSAFAVGSAAIAAWLPARKAAKVDPVDIIRGASG